MEDSRSIGALTRGDVRQLNPAEQDGLNVTISQQRDRTDSPAVVSGSNIGCAGARNAARGASLAWLWFLARLPFARADRSGAGAKYRTGLLLWRPRLLSRTLEWGGFWAR